MHTGTVYRPDVVITHDGDSQDGSLLVAGGRLTLTCTVRIEEELSKGINVSARWLRGEGQEEISSGPVVEVQNENDTYQFEHSFETLSVADSSRYTCEASLSSHHAGVLATAAQSIDITVEDVVPGMYRYNVYIHNIGKLSQCSCNFDGMYMQLASALA